MLNKIKSLFSKPKPQPKPEPEDNRPVRFVEERPNVWRVVYADLPKN